MGKTLKTGLFIIVCLSLVGLSQKAYLQKPYFTRVRFSLPIEEPIFHIALQDHSGYLWLGSSQGLFRFDGKSFARISLDDSPEHDITAIYESVDSTLWVGCKNGKLFYSNHGEMTPFEPEEGTSGTGISDILVDSQGILWWSTYGEGVYYYTLNRVYNINHDDGLSDDYVYRILEDPSGAILAATDNGITRLHPGSDEKKAVPLAVNRELPDIIVTTMNRDEQGRLWLGFQDAGAGYLGPTLASFTWPEAFRNWPWGTVDRLVFSGASLWVATNSSGIIQVDPHDHTAVARWETDDRGYNFGRIHQLLKDREGSIWLLTSTGIYRSTGDVLQFIDQAGELTLDNVHAVMNDSGNKIWFSNNEGIFSYDPRDSTLRQYLKEISRKNTKFMCLAEDRYGYIWAGTFDFGLFRLEPSSGKYRQITERQGLVNNNVLSISTHNDTLWMATLGGASSLILEGPGINSPIKMYSYNQENGLVNTFIYDVYEDSSDRIWFATDGDGICMYNRGVFSCFGESSGIGDDVVYSISGDDAGNIWFSTASDGIYRYDGSEFRHFGLESGLRSLEISSLEISRNEVVIVHGLGIDVLDITSQKMIHYGPGSGLKEMDPELNAISRDSKGDVWIGTQSGIVRYRPGLSGSSLVPNTVIESMAVYLRPVEMTPGMKLGSGQNYISFTYNGLWLTDPDNVVYRVMLAGYDLDWKNTYDRTAVYSSLRPGTYTFKVEASLDPAFASTLPRTFTFTIKKPFWQSTWFFIFIGLILAGMVFSYIRYREQRLRKIEQRKKEKIEFEFQLLKNQVNPHFLFNSFSTLISLIEDDQVQALEYTEKLSDFFRKVLQLKDSEVIPLKEELTLIGDYLFILRKRYGNQIELEINLEENYLNGFIPPMTLQMLMENAVKHNVIAKDRPLRIEIYTEGDYLIVKNGYQPKRQSEASTGIGLENISKRYRLLVNKEIIIERNKGEFIVKLPLI